MIAVDTSALFAIAAGEVRGPDCAQALANETDIVISAATLAETLIVATRKGVRDEMDRLIAGSAMDVVSVTEADAAKVAEAYNTWGKGVHPAALNYGDCFSYVLAKANNCPLLFIGDDFAKTDVTSALRNAVLG